MLPEEFLDIVYDKAKEDGKDYGIICPPISSQKGIDILVDHFLGEDFYVVNPVGAEQFNTEAIYRILEKYKGIKEIEERRIINRIKKLLSKIRDRFNKTKKKKVKYYV